MYLLYISFVFQNILHIIVHQQVKYGSWRRSCLNKKPSDRVRLPPGRGRKTFYSIHIYEYGLEHMSKVKIF